MVTLIVQQGPNASRATFDNARRLGLDVKLLLAEHKTWRAEQARKGPPVNDSNTAGTEPPDQLLISERFPQKSIDLRRKPPCDRPLVASQPFPELSQIGILVHRKSRREHTVDEIFPVGKLPLPSIYITETYERLNLVFPSTLNPKLRWSDKLFEYRNAEVQFIQQQLLAAEGLPADWLVPYATEAVFMDWVDAKLLTDLRGSLISGPTGPAPLTADEEWPVCPYCTKEASFAESLDLRDLEFADLLPGTTIVIFICAACLETGQWSASSTVLWLPADGEITLTDRGNPSPVLQANQWHGPDSMGFDELPEDIQAKIVDLNRPQGHRFVFGESAFPWIPPSYGSKAGGFPQFIGNYETPQDRHGFEMEYIAQISTPDYLDFQGFGYIFHSTTTGETYVHFQF